MSLPAEQQAPLGAGGTVPGSEIGRRDAERQVDGSAAVLDAPSRLQCVLCRKIFNGRRPPKDRDGEWKAASETLDSSGIAELVRIAEDVVGDERDRGRHLDSKTNSLAGFSGLLLAITTALARSIFDLDLGSLGDVTARVGLAVAATGLLLATSLGLAGVQMPQKYRGIGRNQIDDFCGPGWQSMESTEIHRSLLQGLALVIAQDRAVNDCKARIVKGVAVLLLFGFLGLTAAAVTLAVTNL